MLILSQCDFMTKTHDFEDVEESEIQELLDSAKENTEMIGVLKKVKIDIDAEKSFAERKEYYEGLLESICKLAKTKYSASDKEICVAYLLSMRRLDDADAMEHCQTISAKYIDKEDKLKDDIWFLLEQMNYDILAEKARGSSWDFAEIKESVRRLKANKERFEELVTKYEW